MKPVDWYLLGLFPFASIPVKLAAYFIDDLKPTPGTVVAGAAGSYLVMAGIDAKWPAAKLLERSMYIKARSFGFGIEGIHKGRPVIHKGSGMVWKMPIYARAMQLLFYIDVAKYIGSKLPHKGNWGDTVSYQILRSHQGDPYGMPDTSEYI